MIEPSLELQRAVRARLIATPAVVALVAATSIRDGNSRPDQFPTVILGDGQTLEERITLTRKHVRTFLDLHIWTKESGLASVKTIAAAVSKSLSTAPVINGFRLMDFGVGGVRYLRDPGGEHGHAVLSLEALVEAIQ